MALADGATYRALLHTERGTIAILLQTIVIPTIMIQATTTGMVRTSQVLQRRQPIISPALQECVPTVPLCRFVLDFVPPVVTWKGQHQMQTCSKPLFTRKTMVRT